MNKADTYTRQIATSPTKLVDDKGSYHLGTYNQAIPEINLLDAKSPLGFKSPRWMKNIRLREWQAFQIGNKDHFCMAAIFNAKPIGLMHFVHYDIQKNIKRRYEQKVPFTNLQIANGLYDSQSRGKASNITFGVHNKLQAGHIDLKISATHKSLPTLKVDLTSQHSEDVVTPIVVCQPFDQHRVMYSHKAIMPLDGQVRIGDASISFKSDDSWMIIDDHKGYYPRHTKWDWATGGVNEDDNIIGFNLTNNQIQDQENYNENCLWINGDMHPLPPVTFTRKEGIEGPWHITDRYGRIDINFYPDTKTSLFENFLVARTDYDSCYGTFTGSIISGDGVKVSIDHCYGAGERFDITM